MASDAVPLTLDYAFFGKFWKALVSKRKARKLNVDRDLAWRELTRKGENAEFLGAHPAVTKAKSGKGGEGGDAPPAARKARKLAPAKLEPASAPRKRRASEAKRAAKKR